MHVEDWVATEALRESSLDSFVSGGISGSQPIYGPSLAMMDVF